jgi:PPOX class probable F420-dependent enzyme
MPTKTATANPAGVLDRRYSSPDAQPTLWSDARQVLEAAQVYWLTTVRPDGRPHVTPLIAVWHGDALHFCTGADERKARNIAANPHCILTTGCNRINEGTDVVVEGEAARLADGAALKRIADAYATKYGDEWRFDVRDGAFVGQEGNVALVFRVAPRQAFAFAKAERYGQTRWRF